MELSAICQKFTNIHLTPLFLSLAHSPHLFSGFWGHLSDKLPVSKSLPRILLLGNPN